MFYSSRHIEHFVGNTFNELEPPYHNISFLCGICNKNVNKKQLTRKFNKELRKVKLWLDSNMLAHNLGKTNFVLFHCPYEKLSDNFKLKISNQEIQRTKYIKFLGVLMDEHLSWKYHTVELRKELSRTYSIFSKLHHYCPLQTLISLYNSLFSSLLLYGLMARNHFLP